jgi:hypothetical protein
MASGDYQTIHRDQERSQLLAAIARQLRANFDFTDPLPDRLRDLLDELERRTLA